MNLKILLKLKIIVAATFIISLGLAEYLQMSGVINKAMGQSLVRLAQSTSSQLPNSQLQAALDQVVASEKIPGAVMYVSTPDGSWNGASGVSNLESKTPMKPDDGFAIASASKTFVAVVVLQLVQEGKINLDKAIAFYLPKDISANIPYSNTITVRQLLNHTSGVAEYLSTQGFNQATKSRSRQQPWIATEAIEYIYNQKPKAPPGKKYSYTDTNYILLELIVEQTTGDTLAQVIRSRILNPLKLTNTYTELQESGPEDIATGYGDRNKDGKLHSFAQINDGNGLGDGGLISTGEDLSKFVQALFAQKNLLSPEMMKEMFTFVDGTNKEYGLGIERFKTPFGNALGHSGSAYGFVSIMLYLPSKDTTVVVLANKQGVDPKAIAMKGLQVALKGNSK